MNKSCNDGTPCAGKLACTVWSGGKTGDNIKGLPITIAGYADCAESCRIYSGKKRSCAPCHVKEKGICHGKRASELCLRK